MQQLSHAFTAPLAKFRCAEFGNRCCRLLVSMYSELHQTSIELIFITVATKKLFQGCKNIFAPVYVKILVKWQRRLNVFATSLSTFLMPCKFVVKLCKPI